MYGMMMAKLGILLPIAAIACGCELKQSFRDGWAQDGFNAYPSTSYGTSDAPYGGTRAYGVSNGNLMGRYGGASGYGSSWNAPKSSTGFGGLGSGSMSMGRGMGWGRSGDMSSSGIGGYGSWRGQMNGGSLGAWGPSHAVISRAEECPPLEQLLSMIDAEQDWSTISRCGHLLMRNRQFLGRLMQRGGRLWSRLLGNGVCEAIPVDTVAMIAQDGSPEVIEVLQSVCHPSVLQRLEGMGLRLADRIAGGLHRGLHSIQEGVYDIGHRFKEGIESSLDGGYYPAARRHDYYGYERPSRGDFSDEVRYGIHRAGHRIRDTSRRLLGGVEDIGHELKSGIKRAGRAIKRGISDALALPFQELKTVAHFRTFGMHGQCLDLYPEDIISAPKTFFSSMPQQCFKDLSPELLALVPPQYISLIAHWRHATAEQVAALPLESIVYVPFKHLGKKPHHVAIKSTKADEDDLEPVSFLIIDDEDSQHPCTGVSEEHEAALAHNRRIWRAYNERCKAVRRGPFSWLPVALIVIFLALVILSLGYSFSTL